MARKIVSDYAVFNNSPGTTSIVIYYERGGADVIRNLDEDEADYIVDILRHEKPVSYDATRKRLSTYYPEPVGEEETTPDLDRWLNDHRSIRNAIVWESSSGARNYSHWSSSQKQALNSAFLAAWNRSALTLADPPPNAVSPNDNEHATTVLASAHAWPLYLAHVAQSLAVEIGEWVNWSIRSYSADKLKILFDSREFFKWDSSKNGYRIEQSKGRVVPAPPKSIFAFLSNNDCIAYNRLYTIAGLLEWCRSNLVHFLGGANAQNMEDQWQYRGYPPVSRIIAGTPFTGRPSYGIAHRTAGCRGTCGFLRSVLRVVNIPVEQVHACGHALPFFTTENRYLTHGDDPYNALTRATPPYPARELLINQAKYDSWFGPGVPSSDVCNNVGRRTRELAITYLPNYLLYKHCSDIAAGRSHADSEVYEVFNRNYTVSQLEAEELWERLDEKIESFGGCSNIP